MYGVHVAAGIINIKISPLPFAHVFPTFYFFLIRACQTGIATIRATVLIAIVNQNPV